MNTEEENIVKEPGTVAIDENIAEGGAGTIQEHDDEVVVSIGEVEAQLEEEAKAPEWVRELRRSHRETQRELKETKAKLAEATAEKIPAIKAKPSMEDADIDYDADKYEAALIDWYDQKRRSDEAENKAQASAKSQDDAWQEKLSGYGKAKVELKFKDFDEVEAEVLENLSATQQAIIVKGAVNPALVIYGLGKNPAKAKALSSITDPVEFAFAVARMEALELKVTKKNNAIPPPERSVSSNGRVSGTVDSTLERLREDAAKTGDHSKVIQYKAQQRNKS